MYSATDKQKKKIYWELDKANLPDGNYPYSKAMVDLIENKLTIAEASTVISLFAGGDTEGAWQQLEYNLNNQ